MTVFQYSSRSTCAETESNSGRDGGVHVGLLLGALRHRGPHQSVRGRGHPAAIQARLAGATAQATTTATTHRHSPRVCVVQSSVGS